jgi:hypothetical protein
VVKLLPRQLEDDFNDFIGYIKEKIEQIKNENNLTFIAADMGNEPELEDISIELQDFLSKESVDLRRYQRIIEEKESLITSLLNEKTEQENTVPPWISRSTSSRTCRKNSKNCTCSSTRS